MITASANSPTYIMKSVYGNVMTVTGNVLKSFIHLMIKKTN